MYFNGNYPSTLQCDPATGKGCRGENRPQELQGPASPAANVFIVSFD